MLLAGADDEIGAQDGIIEDLRRQLEEAERKRDEALRKRYEFLGNITTIQRLKESAMNKLKELQGKCDSVSGVDPALLARLQSIIDQLES